MMSIEFAPSEIPDDVTTPEIEAQTVVNMTFTEAMQEMNNRFNTRAACEPNVILERCTEYSRMLLQGKMQISSYQRRDSVALLSKSMAKLGLTAIVSYPEPAIPVDLVKMTASLIMIGGTGNIAVPRSDPQELIAFPLLCGNGHIRCSSDDVQVFRSLHLRGGIYKAFITPEDLHEMIKTDPQATLNYAMEVNHLMRTYDLNFKADVRQLNILETFLTGVM